MALKRHLVDNGGKMDSYATTEMERGGMAFYANTGWVPGMDEGANVVSYPASVSGKVPAGILMHTVVDEDPTVIPRNYQNTDKVRVNEKVYLLTDGEVVTNMVDPARLASIKAGPAYVTNSGLFTDQSSGANVNPLNAKFLSGPSADGYVKVSVKMA